MSEIKPNCERWMWIELIGFDSEAADYGVAAFLDNSGFVPEGLSLFVYSPDFVHTHDGLEQEVAFPPDYCSYAGRPYNLDRQRQQWTNWQLKGLVEGLQRRGIKVFFCVFNTFVSLVDGELYRSPWSSEHPELCEERADGAASHCLNPLKRFADGSYYEDFYAERVAAVMLDYGFDGYHGGDGFSSPRQPIWVADYSDDMVEQFVAMMGVELPFAARSAGVSPAAREERADHIWRNLRHEWCEFYARRFGEFWGRICRALHDMGREVVLNNAWTQEPFGALYRYGVDYRRLVKAGVDGFVAETVGAGGSIGAESGIRIDQRHDLNFAPAFMKACLPETPVLCLNGTGDTTENWDVLNHAPAVSEREIYTLGHMYVVAPPEGPSFSRPTLQHASAGPLVCLADGITREQWKWLRENWQVAYEAQPTRPLGATVVWSEAALEAGFEDYMEHRNLTPHKIAGQLQKRGAPLQVVANVRDLGEVSGCLLVPRPELLAQEELAAVMAYDRGPVVMIGRQGAMPNGVETFAEGEGAEQLACGVLGGGEMKLPVIDAVDEESLPEDMPEPGNYLYELYLRPVSDDFLQACVDVLTELTQAPVVMSKREDLRVLALETGEKTVRLMVGNEAHFYVLDKVDMRREVAGVRIAGHFPGKPIYPQGQYLDVRVPPRGMIALDVDLV
ncbi:MAG: hypothetical protein ABFE08_17120 [Armatimonadia bacterium]